MVYTIKLPMGTELDIPEERIDVFRPPEIRLSRAQADLLINALLDWSSGEPTVQKPILTPNWLEDFIANVRVAIRDYIEEYKVLHPEFAEELEKEQAELLRLSETKTIWRKILNWTIAIVAIIGGGILAVKILPKVIPTAKGGDLFGKKTE